jgi:hypothetical protein
MHDLSSLRLPMYFIYIYVDYNDTNEYKTNTVPITVEGVRPTTRSLVFQHAVN